MKYKICLGVVLVLIFMANTASADIFFSNAQMSSSPNPSVEGQPITLTIKINVHDDQTGEVFPATGGHVDFTYRGGGYLIKSAEVHNGIATITVYDEDILAGLGIGENNIMADYHWMDDGVYIHQDIVSVDHEVLPYVKNVQISSSPNPSVEGQPVTIIAKFDFNEPSNSGESYSTPNICGVEFFDSKGIIYISEIVNGSSTVTISSLSPGMHHIALSYGVSSNDYIRYYQDKYTIDQQVNVSTNIPEFSSIALPTIIVLCVIAIIGRRKE